MSEVQREYIEISNRVRSIDRIIHENPVYKNTLQSHIGTKLANKLITKISVFGDKNKLSELETKKLFDELIDKIAYIDKKIWEDFFNEIKLKWEKWLLPWFWYIQFKWFLNKISNLIEEQNGETNINYTEIKDQINGLLNIDQLAIMDKIKMSFLQIKHINNQELSKFWPEFAEKYEKILFQALPNYLQIWSILWAEINNQPQFDWFSWYWKFWSKYVNKDPILLKNTWLLEQNQQQVKQNIELINKAMLAWDTDIAMNSLDFIENNVFWRLEDQIKVIVDNDTWLLWVDLSNIEKYKKKIDNWDKFVVQEFMAEVMKKPEYISYYINNWFEIKDDRLNNILFKETNQETIKEFFQANKITICWKEIKLKDDIDFTDILEDTREEAKELIWNLEVEKPWITNQEKNKIMLNYIKNKLIKELLDNADQTNLTQLRANAF